METKVEALKSSVLRSIEFLIDQLGCSLESYLIQILVHIIKSYPRSNSSGVHTSQHLKGLEIPKRLGFFQETLTSNSLSQSLFIDIKYDHAYENSFLNSVVFGLNESSDLTIKDSQNMESQMISGIKNLQNHILESFISLLSSMSSNILHQIFYEVVLKCIFLQNVSDYS
jgi:hypothetical protein